MAIHAVVLGTPDGHWRLESSTDGRTFYLWSLKDNVLHQQKTCITLAELQAWLAGLGISYDTLIPI